MDFRGHEAATAACRPLRRPAWLALLLLPCVCFSAPDPESSPSRLVSLSPGITATVYALDLQERLVGVTDWCDLPPGEDGILRVGGHVDPSLEAILSLRPDLVIVETANRETRNAVAALGLPFLEIDHRRLDGILDSTLSIGEACGVADHAERLHADLTARMASVREIADRDPSRALVIVGRDVSTGRLRDLYAAGPGTFLGQILEAAGGENPLPSGEIGYPVLSREAVLRLDPEVVFELAPELAGDPDGRVRLGAAWGELSDVAAVRAGRVHILLDQRLLVPGPHFVDILETFASYLYPADGSDR